MLNALVLFILVGLILFLVCNEKVEDGIKTISIIVLAVLGLLTFI